MASVTVWNEFVVEHEHDAVAEVYPEGIHAPLAAGFAERGFDVRTATQGDPDHGLPPTVLEETDVLTWWGHAAQDEVDDDVVARVADYVREGAGLVLLHSGCLSKVARELVGDFSVNRVEQGRERLWTVAPDHPVSASVDECVTIDRGEAFAEPFTMPPPDDLVFVSSFEGSGVVSRSGCYHAGEGRVFYFQPGHETLPVYHDAAVLDVLADAARWAEG